MIIENNNAETEYFFRKGNYRNVKPETYDTYFCIVTSKTKKKPLDKEVQPNILYDFLYDISYYFHFTKAFTT